MSVYGHARPRQRERRERRETPIDARIRRLGAKELSMRRRMLDYVRDGDLTRDEMIAALQ